MPPLSKNFLSQLIFGLFLAVVFLMTGTEPALSIFLGIVGGFSVGLFSNTTKTSPQPPVIGSSEGIDAGLKYWLFFMLGFVFLGYQPPMAILLGAIAALGGGWIIAWWEAKEDSRTQLPVDDISEADIEVLTERPRRSIRKAARRFRKARGFNFPRLWRR
ncbi:MAG: hypothetical protein KME64_19020 [Scytonematopsis contorta HA4267-MV1]|jgi:hypothetical protein|nr:hypothetical protein [Scytonematopsis contorta HA4267-MV1]